jgi:hypothetical protein
MLLSIVASASTYTQSSYIIIGNTSLGVRSILSLSQGNSASTLGYFLPQPQRPHRHFQHRPS